MIERERRQLAEGERFGRRGGERRRAQEGAGQHRMLDAAHWSRFCQHVRAESRSAHSTPPHPHVGFLLKHRNRALKHLRAGLDQSTVPAHVDFCTRLDRLRFKELKTLVLVLAAGRPDWLAKIEAAHTLTEMQRVFIQLPDDGQTVATPPAPGVAQAGGER